MHPTLHCTVLLIWVALERGCGCRLSSRQPKAAPAHSRDAVGDRNLLNPEMGGRQLSVTYSLLLGWEQRFSDIVCRVSRIPEHHSWLYLPFVEARYPVELMQYCQFSHPGSKDSTLFWAQEKLWSCFESGEIFLIYSAQQLWEHEVQEGGERKVVHSCCPSRWFLAAQ